jgi:cell wall assembly regulator SMI1
MNTWQKLIEFWKSSDLELPTGVDAAAISVFESKYKVVLPTDLRTFLENVNGTGDSMDSEQMRFWSIEEIVPVQDFLKDIHRYRYDYPGCFVFADYCVDCWHFVIRLDPETGTIGSVLSCGCGTPNQEKTVIANSFEEFVEMYLADSQIIY